MSKKNKKMNATERLEEMMWLTTHDKYSIVGMYNEKHPKNQMRIYYCSTCDNEIFVFNKDTETDRKTCSQCDNETVTAVEQKLRTYANGVCSDFDAADTNTTNEGKRMYFADKLKQQPAIEPSALKDNKTLKHCNPGDKCLGCGVSAGCEIQRVYFADKVNSDLPKKYQKEFKIYNNLIAAMYDKNHPCFRDFGAEGYVIKQEFLGKDGFKNFLKNLDSMCTGSGIKSRLYITKTTDNDNDEKSRHNNKTLMKMYPREFDQYCLLMNNTFNTESLHYNETNSKRIMMFLPERWMEVNGFKCFVNYLGVMGANEKDLVVEDKDSVMGFYWR